MIKIGVIKEGKVPHDERVPIVPHQIATVCLKHPELRFRVHPSTVRRIPDSEFSAQGIELNDDMSAMDVLIGVKEVPVDELLVGKTYLFFSHTIKKQNHNKKLLKAVLDKKITLIDWECLKDQSGKRLIGFGRFAGIVGTYNAFRAIGLLEKSFSLPKAHDCKDRADIELHAKEIKTRPLKIILTGRGNVANGALEMLDKIGIRSVSASEFLMQKFDESVYCRIDYSEYYKRADGSQFDKANFYAHPEMYVSNFERFARVADIFIAGHFWGVGSPMIFTDAMAIDPLTTIKLVADISCDADGPIVSTIRSSSIADPFYGYDPKTKKEVAFGTANAINVMAVDNLPCELPRDASENFGQMCVQRVLPMLLDGDHDHILKRATIAQNGSLTEPFKYLETWVNT